MPFLWALQSAWFVTALWGSMFCQGTQVTETHSTGISLGPSHRKMSLSVCIASGSPNMPSYSPTQLPAALQHSDTSSLSAKPASLATCVPTGWRKAQWGGGAPDITASFLLVFDNYIHEERLLLLRLWRGSWCLHDSDLKSCLLPHLETISMEKQWVLWDFLVGWWAGKL